MKHALIIAHPRLESFTATTAGAYQQACEELGHQTIRRDLYRMDFDPCLKPQEIPGDAHFEPAADVLAERAMLADCDVFALFYPLWLNTPPAILKGYLERVFGFGFAYGAGGRSYIPLLGGRKFISFSSSGAPVDWLKQIGAFDALCVLFDECFATLCGMTSLDHVHVGGITPGTNPFFVDARLKDVRKAVTQHFGKDEHASHENQA
jgi:NAD(P)H dehydrogenase (quinone)